MTALSASRLCTASVAFVFWKHCLRSFTDCLEEMFYAYNLVLVCKIMENLFVKLKTLRNAMKMKGLKVNVTKVMITGCSVGKLLSIRFPPQFVEKESDAI